MFCIISWKEESATAFNSNWKKKKEKKRIQFKLLWHLALCPRAVNSWMQSVYWFSNGRKKFFVYILSYYSHFNYELRNRNSFLMHTVLLHSFTSFFFSFRFSIYIQFMKTQNNMLNKLLVRCQVAQYGATISW